MSNLTTKTLNGLKWSTIASITTSILQIGYASIMAHLLSPAAFGMMALAHLVLRFGAYFGGMGLVLSIVQKEEITENDIRASFTSSIFLGIFVSLTIIIIAPYSLLIFPNDPELVPILRAMAVTFFISGFSNTAANLLRRNINFKELSIAEVISNVIGYFTVGIILAYYDFGVWTLVYATICQSTLYSIITFFYSRHTLKLIFGWRNYKHLFNYGGKSTLISFTEFLGSNLDTMLIGKFLGAKQLGFYNRGYTLINLPLNFLTNNLAKVLFPSFSKIQSDLEKLKKVYLSSITLVASTIIPVSVGIIFAAREIVLVLLGDKFIPSIPVLQFLSVAMPLSFIVMFAGTICDATANLNKKLIATASFILIQASLFVAFQKQGLIGFSIAVLLGQILRTVIYMYLMNQVLKTTYFQILKCYFPAVISSILVGGSVYITTILLTDYSLPTIILLILQSTAGSIAFALSTFILPHPTLKVEIQTILSKLSISNNGIHNKIMGYYVNYLK